MRTKTGNGIIGMKPCDTLTLNKSGVLTPAHTYWLPPRRSWTWQVRCSWRGWTSPLWRSPHCWPCPKGGRHLLVHQSSQQPVKHSHQHPPPDASYLISVRLLRLRHRFVLLVLLAFPLSSWEDGTQKEITKKKIGSLSNPPLFFYFNPPMDLRGSKSLTILSASFSSPLDSSWLPSPSINEQSTTHTQVSALIRCH